MADNVDVILYTITDDARVLHKTLSSGSTYSCTFRAPVDVKDPTIRISTSDNLSDINYMYISRYGRYYFVNRIDVGPNELWTLTGHVDVLMSNQTQLEQLSGTLERSETVYNGYLNDPEYKALAYRQIVTKQFPNAIDQDSFILVTVG